jgi:hypothetical protein
MFGLKLFTKKSLEDFEGDAYSRGVLAARLALEKEQDRIHYSLKEINEQWKLLAAEKKDLHEQRSTIILDGLRSLNNGYVYPFPQS